MPSLADISLRLLHRLPPELAHKLVVASLATLPVQQLLKITKNLPDTTLKQPILLFGKQVPNPIAAAAGLDKDARFVPALFSLGFGIVEVGTVTPQPQLGNPTPRLFRLPAQKALINRMGFNNRGLEQMVKRLKKLRQKPLAGMLGVNIGKNKDTPDANQDYLTGLRSVYPYADYITVNLSSPNTPGLRDLLKPENLPTLIKACQQERTKLSDNYGFSVPLLLKISPDLTEKALAPIVQTLLKHNWQGIISTNTTTSRPPICSLDQSGGLSGTPLFPIALKMLSSLKKLAGPELVLIGCGGISSPEDMQKMLSQGATAVQIYTAFVYQGPTLLNKLLKYLLKPCHSNV